MLVLCLLWVSEISARVSDKTTRFACESLAVFYEARGESAQVQQKVLDVLRNRAYSSNKSVCGVLKEPGQFPWRKSVKTMKLTQEQAEFGFKLLEHASPVRSKYMYFNTEKFCFAKKHVKHGNLYFTTG